MKLSGENVFNAINWPFLVQNYLSMCCFARSVVYQQQQPNVQEKKFSLFLQRLVFFKEFNLSKRTNLRVLQRSSAGDAIRRAIYVSRLVYFVHYEKLN